MKSQIGLWLSKDIIARLHQHWAARVGDEPALKKNHIVEAALREYLDRKEADNGSD